MTKHFIRISEVTDSIGSMLLWYNLLQHYFNWVGTWEHWRSRALQG